MPQVFKIDQAATFSALAFLECAPRPAFGKPGVQELTKQGIPRWDVQLIAGFRDAFGNNAHEVIKVGIVAEKDPAVGINPYTPVHMIAFEVGVTPPEVKRDDQGRERISGGTVWYRCASIQPVHPSRKDG